MSAKHTPYIDPRVYDLNHVCVKAYERWPTCGQTSAARDIHRGKQRLPEPAELLPGLAMGDGERPYEQSQSASVAYGELRQLRPIVEFTA